MNSFKIIVVEDEKSIREMVCLYLTDAGYEVKGYEDGISALVDFDHFKPHLAILDIMMKGIDGFETLRLIRDKAQIPVLMLTAKTLEKDRLKGFELGADDYIVKPFSPKEVVSRVNVFVKRIYGNESSNIKSYGNLKIDFDKHILVRQLKASVMVIGTVVLILTALFGPVFCSHICPLGSIQEWFGKLGRRIFKK